MESVDNFVDNMLANKYVVLVWAVFIIIALLILVFSKEKFLGEFRQAPLAVQRPPSLLGNGSFSRFSSEFSSTNQGGDNLTSGNASNFREHLTGGMEPPVIQSSVIPSGLNNWQRGNIGGVGDGDEPEAFTSNANFREAFKTNDDVLTQILKGN